VPSVQELMATGQLSATPSTRLVHDPTDISDPV
jgi:hypothetical protein